MKMVFVVFLNNTVLSLIVSFLLIEILANPAVLHLSPCLLLKLNRLSIRLMVKT